MEIVMLAAGTSSRMGKQDKLLLPYKDKTLACHCCLQALSYLENLEESSNLIVVTGYRKASLEKSLQPCKSFIEKTKAPITMTIIENKDYRKGQFSSTRVGVSQVSEKKDFFICLADMPLLKAEHFKEIAETKGDFDCVRPFFEGKPGHPVFLSSTLRKAILDKEATSSVREILSKYNVLNYKVSDKAFVTDCDTPEEFSKVCSEN